MESNAFIIIKVSDMESPLFISLNKFHTNHVNVSDILTSVLKRTFSWYSLFSQQPWGTLTDDSWSNSTTSFSFFKALSTSFIRPPILPAIFSIKQKFKLGFLKFPSLT